MTEGDTVVVVDTVVSTETAAPAAAGAAGTTPAGPDQAKVESEQIAISLSEPRLSADEPLFAPLAAIRDWLHTITGLSPGFIEHLGVTMFVVAILWLIRLVVLRVVYRRVEDVRERYRWRKATTYAIVFFGLFVLVRVWFVEFRALATFFGLIGAGLAIALRDPVVNLGGWIFIVWRRPFAPGDRVEVLDRVGDVIDLRLFQFTLLEVGTKTGASQSTGRIIHIPNGVVFQNALVNYTRGFHYVWNELSVVVTFKSDWRAAKDIVLKVAEEHAEALGEDAERRLRRAAQEYMIFYSQLSPTVYTSVEDHGVQLTMRYLSDPRRLRGSEMLMWEAILDAFAARGDIDFAYPTTRFYDNRAEGKPGTGGPPAPLDS